MLRVRLVGGCLVAAAGFFAATSLASRVDTPAAPGSAASSSSSATIVRVVDGDTLVVRLIAGGKQDRIRVLGIDAPEMSPRERCAAQATSEARRLVQGKTVSLVGDRTQAKRDRFRRLLAYVTLPDGSDLGRRLIATGYAKVYMYRGTAFLRLGTYRLAERGAKTQHFGLWGNCSTKTIIPLPVPKPAPPTPTTTALPTTTLVPFVPTTPTTTGTTIPTTTATTSQTTTTTTTTTGTTTGTTTTAPPSYACSNGTDDDGDGKIDYPADPGCTSSTDTDETDPAPPPPPSNCSASYPDFCIPPPPPDKNCSDFSQKNFSVLQPDPHHLDGDKDGLGCET